MRRSGTAWPLLLLACATGCGDRVVVARGVTRVSAAQSVEEPVLIDGLDAGVADAGKEPDETHEDTKEPDEDRHKPKPRR